MLMTGNADLDEAPPAIAADAPSTPSLTRSHLPALDGLRFIAAGFVLIAHGYHYLVILQDNTKINSYNAPIMALSTIGMTLFFVLSGFVIHYNYAETVSLSGGVRAFFVARFARLYPLFLMVFLIETARAMLHPDGKTDLFGPLPLFLTFTESWWFWASGERVAFEAYSNATGLMWSLSTEAFFYLVYPMLAPSLRGLRGRRLLLIGAIIAVTVGFLMVQVIGHVGALMKFAQRYTGNAQTADQFPHWLMFNSPWLRIFEFLLGALAAQFVLTTKLSARRARIACGAALAVLGVAYLYTNVELMPLSGGISTVLSFTIAIIIATSAGSSHRFAQVLSSRWMVRGGEASYSLYLLHYWIMHGIGHKLADFQPTGIRVLIYLILMVVSVVAARICYLVFERPATRFVRRQLSAQPFR